MTFELQFIALGIVAALLSVVAAFAAKPVLAQGQPAPANHPSKSSAPCMTGRHRSDRTSA